MLSWIFQPAISAKYWPNGSGRNFIFRASGFYGDEHNVRIKVLNAVRQTVDGGKVWRLSHADFCRPRQRNSYLFPPATVE